MDIIKCDNCGKILAHCKFPWDAGGGEEYFCLKCKPLTKKEKEFIEYSQYIKNKQSERGNNENH